MSAWPELLRWVRERGAKLYVGVEPGPYGIGDEWRGQIELSSLAHLTINGGPNVSRDELASQLLRRANEAVGA